MDFTEAQRNAIILPHTLVVTAGAGSGKTRVLVERYLRLLLEDVQQSIAFAEPADASDLPSAEPADILAITFTDKAAREMRTRVRDTLEKRACAATDPAERAIWEERRAQIEAAHIETIHAFCGAVLRAHPAETGLDPQFAVLDDIQQDILLRDSVDATLRDIAAQATPDAALDEQLTALREQLSVAELRDLLVVLLQGGTEVQAAVDALPTTPAELRGHWQTRLQEAQATTLHELRSSDTWKDASADIQRMAAHAPPADRMGGQVCKIAEWLASSPLDAASPDFVPVREIDLRGGRQKDWGGKDALQAAKDALRTLRDAYRAHAAMLELQPDEDNEHRAALVTAGVCALYRRAVATYTHHKEQQDMLDFDDMLQHARYLFDQHPAALARWQAAFRAVLVDEFQDTNDEQRAIIYALAGFAADAPGAATPATPELFVVGDGKQSIYRFRGADVSVFRRVEADIRKRDGHVVALDTSFRTHPPLLNWINRVSEAVFARAHPLLPYEVPFEELRPHRVAPAHTRCVELHILDGAENAEKARTQEAGIIAERIKALVSGNEGPVVYDRDKQCWRKPDYGDITLLFQASTAFAYYEAALREAEIPYLTTAGRGYYARQEVQDLLHLLRVLNDPADELALAGVLRSPFFALDDATLLRLRFANRHSLWDALLASGEDSTAPPADDESPLTFARTTLRSLYAMRGRMTVIELLRHALAMTGYLATVSGLPDGAQRRANIEKLLEAARQMGGSGLLAFSAYLEDVLRAGPREGEAPLEAEGSVRLMTVHRSKGLEFPIVVLPDLGRKPPAQREIWLARRAYGLALRLRDRRGEQQPSVAYALASHEEQRMEQAERERLLYVALTRASDHLILAGPAARSSNAAWLSRLVTALGCPWEDGGPPPGDDGPMTVWRHIAENDRTATE